MLTARTTVAAAAVATAPQRSALLASVELPGPGIRRAAARSRALDLGHCTPRSRPIGPAPSSAEWPPSLIVQDADAELRDQTRRPQGWPTGSVQNYPTLRTPRYAYGDAGRSGSTISRESAVTAATTPSMRFFEFVLIGRTFSFASSLTPAFATHQAIVWFSSWWTRPDFVSRCKTLQAADSACDPRPERRLRRGPPAQPQTRAGAANATPVERAQRVRPITPRPPRPSAPVASAWEAGRTQAPRWSGTLSRLWRSR